ncbi:MAG: hypothetical protein WC859_00870 [Elusimicrobiota bacterium]|jgi:hypothetical protein
MTDPKNSHGDEHIEDLLSQLQGIFGRLSHSEEEESKDKIDVSEAPKGPVSAPPLPAASSPPGEPVPSTTLPVNEPAAPPAEPVPPTVGEPVSSPVEPAPVEPAPTLPAPAFESSITDTPEDHSILPTAVIYPADREGQAKTLAQKIERLTPKFTKVSFRLRVQTFRPYDPKSDWKEMLISNATEGLRAIFFVVDRPLDEARRKPLVTELESKGIYFQDVPLLSIEKNAFYTDLLLGLVFFFDTQKPPTAE